jgi:hypothetical protein
MILMQATVLRIQIRAFLTLGSGMSKKQDPDPGSRTGMNNPEHIAKRLETIFWVKILNSLMRIRDPGW